MSRISWHPIAGLGTITLAVVIGCGKAPPVPETGPLPDVQIAPTPIDPNPQVLPGVETAPEPRPRPPFVGIRKVPGTKEEQARFVSHVPEPIRKLYASNFQLFQDLGGKAFAWESVGGPVRLWMEFEEKSQSTVPNRYPEQDDWLINGETGRLIFWIRRGVSDKINTVLKRVGKPEGDTSAVGLGVMISSSAGGVNHSVGYVNPLWYGWSAFTFETDWQAKELPLPDYKPAPILVLNAREVIEGDKEPRQAKMVLKIQRVKPE